MTASLQDVAIAVVTVGWVAFLASIVARARARWGSTRRRDARSIGGMLTQGAGMGLVFGVEHAWSGPAPSSALRAVASILLAGAGAAMMVAAVRTLGKQWSLSARMLEDHELVTTGPYALVRHPIYSGLLALLVATGLARTDLATTLLAALVYVGGTLLRTRREEGLLRETFGAEYESYAERVPALIPRLGPRG